MYRKFFENGFPIEMDKTTQKQTGKTQENGKIVESDLC